MPWNPSSIILQRRSFVHAASACKEPFSGLCKRFGISRRAGYKWLERYREKGEAGLEDASRRPAVRGLSATQKRWQQSALAQRKRLLWGPRKLLWFLRRKHPRTEQLPSERTLARLLKTHGLIGPRKRRSPGGPKVVRSPCTIATARNEVWTVDFKGHFQTADGAHCEPLTIRDLYSRYVLMVEHVAQPSEAVVRRAMTRCMNTYGLPKVIRVDNGAPFGGCGALGLTRLSVWWVRLGIRVEFTRRAKPQDNGAHEQMHRVLKAQTARQRPPCVRKRGALPLSAAATMKTGRTRRSGCVLPQSSTRAVAAFFSSQLPCVIGGVGRPGASSPTGGSGGLEESDSSDAHLPANGSGSNPSPAPKPALCPAQASTSISAAFSSGICTQRTSQGCAQPAGSEPQNEAARRMGIFHPNSLLRSSVAAPLRCAAPSSLRKRIWTSSSCLSSHSRCYPCHGIKCYLCPGTEQDAHAPRAICDAGTLRCLSRKGCGRRRWCCRGRPGARGRSRG
jgi:transposase InsO family protein